MNNYNPNMHHRKSIRMKGYDYSKSGLYFITICVKDRACLFGEIVDGKMNLNGTGNIADECWMEIPRHFPDAVLHEHVVMPNHVHGIIELMKSGSPTVGVQNFEPHQSIIDSASTVGVQNFEPLQSPNGTLSSIVVENFQPQRNEFQKIIPHSIGSIVKGFKIGVTKWVRNNSVGPVVWQRNFYEHIIRNEQACQQIADYIINNPKNWEDDDFNFS